MAALFSFILDIYLGYLTWVFNAGIYCGYLSWLVDETRLELN